MAAAAAAAAVKDLHSYLNASAVVSSGISLVPLRILRVHPSASLKRLASVIRPFTAVPPKPARGRREERGKLILTPEILPRLGRGDGTLSLALINGARSVPRLRGEDAEMVRKGELAPVTTTKASPRHERPHERGQRRIIETWSGGLRRARA